MLRRRPGCLAAVNSSVDVPMSGEDRADEGVFALGAYQPSAWAAAGDQRAGGDRRFWGLLWPFWGPFWDSLYRPSRVRADVPRPLLVCRYAHYLPGRRVVREFLRWRPVLVWQARRLFRADGALGFVIDSSSLCSLAPLIPGARRIRRRRRPRAGDRSSREGGGSRARSLHALSLPCLGLIVPPAPPVPCSGTVTVKALLSK
jgi:hypothetical protein